MSDFVVFVESGKFALWVWAFVSPILAALTVAILAHVVMTLAHLNRILKYVDHLRELMVKFEQWPMTILEMLYNFTGGKK